jgi:hypothetical protein
VKDIYTQNQKQQLTYHFLMFLVRLFDTTADSRKFRLKWSKRKCGRKGRRKKQMRYRHKEEDAEDCCEEEWLELWYSKWKQKRDFIWERKTSRYIKRKVLNRRSKRKENHLARSGWTTRVLNSPTHKVSEIQLLNRGWDEPDRQQQRLTKEKCIPKPKAEGCQELFL